jgi:dTDP-4-amino-4,6-dideoxygalactose transaminase
VGTLGAWAAFSFYATKNMTTGEGGMVACANDEVARQVRLLRNQGMERRYANEVVGLNNRLTDVAAALGRVQLRHLAERNTRRRQIAQRYEHGLLGVRLPSTRAGDVHAFHQYTVRVPRRDAVLDAVRARGVDAAVYYPTPVHRLPAFGLAEELPHTETAAAEVISLPIHPSLTDREVDHVIETVNKVTASEGASHE